MKLDVDVNLHLLQNSIEDLKLQINNEKEEGRGWMLKFDELDVQFEILVEALYKIRNLDPAEEEACGWIANEALNKVNR
jgi:hypothetical protein